MRWFSCAMLLLLCVCAFMAYETNAQVGDYPPIAAYGLDQHLWLYEAGKDPRQVTDASSLIGEDLPLDLAWSPDGTRLAYRSIDGLLSVLNMNDDTVTHISGYPFDELPFAFTMDGKHILFGVDGGADGSMGPSYLDIVAADVKTGLQTGDGVCCIERSTGYAWGLEVFLPPTRVVGEEWGWHISGTRLLDDTPFGILHSSMEGLQLDGETIWPSSYAVLSPDRTRVATDNVEVSDNHIVYLEGIAILDLATQKHTAFKTDSEPSWLSWGGNDVIFYTSAESTRDLYDELNDEEKQRLKNQIGDVLENNDSPYLPHNQVYIHQVKLSDGSEKVIYQGEAFTIGRLMPAPDGREVYFTTIPNMDDWLETIVNSEIGCNYYGCIRPLFPPSLYRLDLVSGQTDLIGVGLYRATINFGAYKPSCCSPENEKDAAHRVPSFLAD